MICLGNVLSWSCLWGHQFDPNLKRSWSWVDFFADLHPLWHIAWDQSINWLPSLHFKFSPRIVLCLPVTLTSYIRSAIDLDTESLLSNSNKYYCVIFNIWNWLCHVSVSVWYQSWITLQSTTTFCTGTGTIIPTYPLSPPMLFYHKGNIYMPISNFNCKEPSLKWRFWLYWMQIWFFFHTK